VAINLDWSRSRAGYSVSFGADTQNVGRARQLILRDLKDMQTNPVHDTELARAKAEMLRRLPMQWASVNGMAAQYLRYVELGMPPLNAAQIGAEHYLDITADEIRQAFATWIRPDDLAEAAKGPGE
jgi:zinc protease